MRIKTAYYYLFYKFYKFAEWSPSIFPSDLVASLLISMIETMMVFSVNFFYIEYFSHYNNIKLWTPKIIIPLIIIFIINYDYFVVGDKWKPYIKGFERFSKRKNRIGTWIVVFLVALVLAIIAISVVNFDEAPRNSSSRSGEKTIMATKNDIVL